MEGSSMTSWRRKIRTLGPGLLVTAAFIGPGTVTTASAAGARFGYALLWAIVFAVGTGGNAEVDLIEIKPVGQP